MRNEFGNKNGNDKTDKLLSFIIKTCLQLRGMAMDTEGLSKLHCIRDMNELERDGFFTLTKSRKMGR